MGHAPTATNAEEGAGTRRSGALLLLAAVALLVHALLTSRFHWVTDDAYISFRYARNLALGEGLRFNVWDRPPVEGYSNFLWVVVAGGVHALGLDMVRWMPVLSWLCGAGLLAILLHRLVRVLDVPLPIAGAVVIGLACYPPFAVWSTSGLATMPFALLLFLTFDRLVLDRGGPDWRLGGTYGALLALIRVEGIAWFAVVLVLAVVGPRSRDRVRASLRAAGIVALVYAGYFAWRYGYYGEVLPNTAHAKDVSGWEFHVRGYRYVMASWLTFLVPFLLLPATFSALRRKRISVGLGAAALAWAFPVYAVVVAGDYMPMGRFLVPGLAFSTLLLAWMLADLAGKSRRRTAVATALAAGIGVVGALPGWDVHVVPDEQRAWCNYRMKAARKSESEYARWVDLSEKANRWRERGRQVRAYAEESLTPPVSMAIRALGAVGYETDFHMHDCAGLVVPEIARRRVTEWRDQPGHDKAVKLDYFAAAHVTILRFWTFDAGEPRDIAGSVKRAAREWVDPEVRDHYRLDLVELSPSDGGASVYLLALVHDEEATAKDWRTFERITPADIAGVRKIPY